MKRQHGFGAIAAIVVLVILAVLAAGIVSISTTQQMTSAQDVMSARAWQAARAGNEWGLYQALHRYFTVANGGGVAGDIRITTTNNFFTARVAAGIAVGGTGVGAGARVTSVDSANQITVDVANAGIVSGDLTFGSTPPAGTWQSCPGGTNTTLDLRTDTGFYVTVSCDSWQYKEGESVPGTAQTVWIYQIKAVACPATPCPPTDSSVAAGAGYIERTRVVLATDK